MIPLSEIVSQLNAGLNNNTAGITFNIVADSGEYIPPTRNLNNVTEYIQGAAEITDSDIVPVQGLVIVSETVNVEIGVAIDPDEPNTTSNEPIRNIISAYLSKPQVTQMTDENGNVYSVSMFGSQPTTGDLALRDNYGYSITYEFSIEYTFIENGINSYNVTIEFEGEAVPFTDFTITRTPVMDGGAFSNSNGTAKNYVAVTGLEISFSVPALTDSVLTQEFISYLLTGTQAIYNISLGINGNTQSYNMIFAQSNASLSGVDNMGLSISLVEALEVNNGTV